jgi:hypothetical protein
MASEVEKILVWSRGHEIPGLDPNVWRRDDCQFRMRYADYGDRASEYGWEIDHITPTVMFGGDTIPNKRPLNWRANAGLGGIVGALASASRKSG